MSRVTCASTCLVLVGVVATAGCHRAAPVAADEPQTGQGPVALEQAPPNASAMAGAAGLTGEWDGEYFPGLVLRLTSAGVLEGEYAKGEGHFDECDAHGDTLDFRFFRGAKEFHGAQPSARGIGSGKLDASGNTIKGTYTTDMFEEGRWSVTRVTPGGGAPPAKEG